MYPLEVIRERLETPDMRRLIDSAHQQWRAATILIEDTDVGCAIGQELWRSSRIVRPLMWRPKRAGTSLQRQEGKRCTREYKGDAVQGRGFHPATTRLPVVTSVGGE